MKYFTMQELSMSDTATRLGIDNTPDDASAANLEALVEEILDPLRELYGYPINVSSGYRSPLLNSKVGGSKTSDHQKGCAADIYVARLKHDQVAMRIEHKKLFKMLLKMLQEAKHKWNQIIWEKGTDQGPQWIHVAYKQNGLNYCQLLRTNDGKNYYSIDENGKKVK